MTTMNLQDKSLFQPKACINGEWLDSEQNILVTDPATGAEVGRIPVLSPDQARQAVDAAQQAFSGWDGLLPQQRTEYLSQWAQLMYTHREDLARIMTAEQGKPISEARGEIDYAASFLEYYAEEAKRPNLESVTSHLPDAEMELWLEPVGVVALVTPWNFPSAMLTRKAAAALAAGCTVVAHPSAETPFSATALAVLAERAGIPPGVFNVVTGQAPEIVGEWTADDRVRALSFTGSTNVGKLLYRQSADTMKRLVLELGGHAPVLVFADSNLDQAVAETIKAKYATSGQDCLGANRIYVERSIYLEYCEKLVEAVEKLSIGNGFDDPDIGPLMNEAAVQKQQSQLEDALGKNARLLVGGKKHSCGPLFFEPTVLADVPDDALIMQEENFGVLAPVTPFDDEAEVIRRANSTNYGLVAYVHTNDPRRIYRLTRALQFGMVAVNRTKVTGAPIPFGGVKHSGLGREGARFGLQEFMNIKYVCRDWS